MRWSSAAAVLLVFALVGCGGGKTHASAQPASVITKAKAAFARARARGVDMSRGPCLGVVAPGWVADVAHNPRQPVDDVPRNQCAAFRSGKAKHFVELDLQGNLIRTGP
jgi:hypothetical protein